jgi:transcription elongation factor/antiterminator RfaH
MQNGPWIARWYVLHTRSRFENVVREGLEKKSFEVFLPKVQVRSRRRDRKVLLRMPLFPGYVFVKTDLNPYAQVEIVKTTGVARFIGNRDGPISVLPEALASLRIMVAGDRPVTTGSDLQPGDRVIVVAGPFTGVTGLFVRHRGLGRVVVNVEALGQYAAVNVKAEEVERLSGLLL